MSWHYLCELSEIVERRSREYLVEGRVIAAFYTEQQVHAVDGICAHQGGPLAQGRLDGKCLTCPWHGWQYNIADGTNLLSGKQMLECFTTQIRGSEVWLEIPFT